MNTTQLIVCNSVSLIVFAFVIIKFKLDLNRIKKEYDTLFRSTQSIELSRIEALKSQYYNQKCHLENLVEAQSERLKQYQQLLNKD